ncbi:hypothetical protein LRP30_43400 [Bradyrhizobium sp. C-145]|uniref:hypothetical protein n=1 Tax=Bradyrhizobium sp. C-145 TaxID=574727 RepID=UPI00201B95D9|nr:hypothetical protein [Bradyrhizobium sp. C-145]UQR63477.1 hypothetical protein LRP30_43400 [Bradyrhizobium sp. C-145]
MTPGVAVPSAEAADVSWMESDAERVTFKLELCPARHADRLRLAEQASRCAAKSNDHAWPGTPNVDQHCCAKAIDFLDCWAAITWLPIFGMRDWPERNGVCQTHLLGIDPSFIQHLAQRPAGRTDKRPALRSFLCAGCLANHVEPRSSERAFRRDTTVIEMCIGDACLGHWFRRQAWQCKCSGSINCRRATDFQQRQDRPPIRLGTDGIDASFRRAGLVEKWDGGTYEAEGATSAAESERTMRAGLRRGRMSFVLKGSKFRGAYSLVRLKSPTQWLLIKTHAKK